MKTQIIRLASRLSISTRPFVQAIVTTIFLML